MSKLIGQISAEELSRGFSFTEHPVDGQQLQYGVNLLTSGKGFLSGILPKAVENLPEKKFVVSWEPFFFPDGLWVYGVTVDGADPASVFKISPAGVVYTFSLDVSEETSQPFWQFIRWGNWVIINRTDGQLLVDKRSPVTGTTLEVLTEYFDWVKVLVATNEFVHAFNTSENGGNAGIDWHWCALDNPESWTPSATTQAGNLPLRELEAEITAVELFSNTSLGIYTQTNRIVGEYLGAPLLWAARSATNGIGVKHPSALMRIGDLHYAVADTGIYRANQTTVERLDMPDAFNALHYNFWSKIDEEPIEGAPGATLIYLAYDKQTDTLYVSYQSNWEELGPTIARCITYNLTTKAWGRSSVKLMPKSSASAPNIFWYGNANADGSLIMKWFTQNTSFDFALPGADSENGLTFVLGDEIALSIPCGEGLFARFPCGGVYTSAEIEAADEVYEYIELTINNINPVPIGEYSEYPCKFSTHWLTFGQPGNDKYIDAIELDIKFAQRFAPVRLEFTIVAVDEITDIVNDDPEEPLDYFNTEIEEIEINNDGLPVGREGRALAYRTQITKPNQRISPRLEGRFFKIIMREQATIYPWILSGIRLFGRIKGGRV